MEGNRSVIARGYQALVPSYKFNCNGNITQWLVGVTSSLADNQIEMELQVWRPVSNNGRGACFTKVGSNLFTVSPTVQVANYTPSEQIEFRSGDVLGFRLLSPSQAPVTEQGNNREDNREGDDDRSASFDGDRLFDGDDDDNGDDSGGESRDDDDSEGVVILNEVDNTMPEEEVWFSRIADTLLDRDSDGCGLSIGYNGILNSFTNAAPLISASVLVVDDIQGMTFSSSTQEFSPITAEEERDKVLITASATTASALLLIVTVIIVVGTCTYCLVKRRRKHINDNHSMPGLGGVPQSVNPTVYRRDVAHVTGNSPLATRVPLVPQRAVLDNGNVRSNRSERTNATHDAMVSGSRVITKQQNDKPIVMYRNESYGKLTTIADCDAEYYFMYDYPDV